MSDTPKFTVIDRRKFKADEEASQEAAAEKAASEAKPEPVELGGGPRLVVNEPRQEAESG